MSYIGSLEIKEALDKILASPLDLEELAKFMAQEQSEKYKDMFSEPIGLEPLSFNPIVYDNEPYTPAETAQDIVNDYINALNVLRIKYLETNDERYARLLLDLVPADTYWRYS